MQDAFKKIGVGVGIFSCLFMIVALVFGLRWLGIEWRGFFGPKEADVEREIFRGTRSYDEGMIQQLSRFRLQYMKADTIEEREAIKSTVRQMFAEYDPDRLPSKELRDFMKEVYR